MPSEDNTPPPLPHEVEPLELEPPFELVADRRYPCEIEYTPDEFIAVLGTYSGHIALPAARREELFRRLHARASAQGTVRKLYVFALTIARKR
jgi:hypothetical protein